MRLTEYLSGDHIWTQLPCGEKAQVVRTISQRIAEAGIGADAEELERRLLEREKIRSTGIGNRIAVPHAILPGTEKTELFIGVCADGTDFEAADQIPVKLFLVLVGPESDRGSHLKLLARIFRLTHNPEFVDDLINAEDASGLLNRIESEEALHV